MYTEQTKYECRGKNSSSNDDWKWLKVDIEASTATYMDGNQIVASLALRQVTDSSFTINWHVASWLDALFELNVEGLLEKGMYVWKNMAQVNSDGPNQRPELDNLLLAEAQAAFSYHQVDLLGIGERLVLTASCENKNDVLFKTCREILYHDVFGCRQVELEMSTMNLDGSVVNANLKKGI